MFKTFSINFFTYGFPVYICIKAYVSAQAMCWVQKLILYFICFHGCQVSLFALSFWSFHFASLCAFGLLAYVGYIIYAFPSLFRLHRLNGLLLVFILLWAVSTYIFNVAFSFLNTKVGKVISSLCAEFKYSKALRCQFNPCRKYAGHENLGDGGTLALHHTWVLSACTIWFGDVGCVG